MRIIVGLAALLVLGACATESVPAPTLVEPTQSVSAVVEPTQEQAAPTEETVPPTEEQVDMAFEIMSSAFAPEDSIPATYSCDGADISPPLSWTDPPNGTKSFALIFDDPDAPGGTWVHWVLFDLPTEARSLPEAVGPDSTLGVHGSNSWNSIGYGGPCPPGGEHRYFFKLYALDSVLELELGATKEQVLEAMEDHILAQTELMGTYSR
ncbi:MAG: YbhB/YbcL family Raf kinase inhibitor-like protein [Anaerolineales bacterium]